MRVNVWPTNGRVMYIDDSGKLRRVTPAVGTFLPSFCLQVLALKAKMLGLVLE